MGSIGYGASVSVQAAKDCQGMSLNTDTKHQNITLENQLENTKHQNITLDNYQAVQALSPNI